MSDTALIVLLVAIIILGVLVLPQWFVSRAIRSVIRIFRQNNAVGLRNAKTVDELGLRPLTIIEKLWKPRDYKPRALQLLIRANIVQVTEEGKLYLSEENLAVTRWKGN